MASSKLVVGAHLLVFVNGQRYGLTVEGAITSTTAVIEHAGLDTYEPLELAQGPARISGNLSVYRLHAGGGSQAAGMVAPFADLALMKYFSIMIVDRLTDTVVFRADRCALESEAWRFATKGYVLGSLSFKAISWSNETIAKTPSGS